MLKCQLFGDKGMVRNVFGLGATDLLARTATGLKAIATGDKVAATGEGVRVVQRPDDRHVIRDRLKKGWVVKKERNPVKVDDVVVGPFGGLRNRCWIGKPRHRIRFKTLRTFG